MKKFNPTTSRRALLGVMAAGVPLASINDRSRAAVPSPALGGEANDTNGGATVSSQVNCVSAPRFQQSGPEAVYRSAESKLREIKSVGDWGAVGNGEMDPAALRMAIESAWAAALDQGHDLFFPDGVYDIGPFSFPWRAPGASSKLLDCKNITIFGSGPRSVLKTTSIDGADVFQLNAIKNLHIRNLKIVGALTDSSGSGTNGISITGGFDNISILDVWIESMPSIDKGVYVDGGKALTVQCDAASLEVGMLKARIFAKGCAQGFGFESGLTNMLRKKVAIDVDLVAEDCFQAVAIGAKESSGSIPKGTHTGIRVKALAINCQRDLDLSRAHGIEVECQSISTKSARERRLNPHGTSWSATDTIVEALKCAYAKNSQIKLTGNKGACDYKARIGGAPAGLSGQFGTTEFCDIFLDIGGTSDVEDIAEIDFGGNSLSNSVLTVTTTTGTIPTALYLPSRQNLLIAGTQARVCAPTVSGDIGFTGDDGRMVLGQIRFDHSSIEIQQLATSAHENWNLRIADNRGAQVLGFRQDGKFSTKGTVPANNVSVLVRAFEIFDENNVSIGWVPIYKNSSI